MEGDEGKSGEGLPAASGGAWGDEEALRLRAELLELSHEPVFAWEFGGDGVAYWNRGAEELYGFSKEEAVGSDNHRLLRTVHPVPLGQVEAGLARDGRWEGELKHTTRDGRRVVVESRQALVETSDGRRLVLETNRDVTERRRAERAFEESERRLGDILDNSPMVVYAKDPGGRFLLVNRRFEELFGVGREEVVGKTDRDLFPERAADRFRANDEEVLRTGVPLEAEETVPREDGKRTYLSVKFPLRDAGGAPYAVCGISADITGRRRAEEALAEAREDERRRISRDLHDSVLQDLSGALQALQLARLRARRSGLDLDLSEEIEALQRAAEGLRGAVYALRREGERPFVRAVEGLVGSERRTTPDREVELSVQEGFPEELPERLSSELLRVLREALTNVRKHSGARRVGVALREEGDALVVEVADDGWGFDKGEARETPGGGVGLSAMRERVESLGGTLEVRSRPGEGTRVTAVVPF